MTRLLIIEDSALLGTIVIKRLREQLEFELHLVRTFAEFRQHLSESRQTYDYALVDLNLPDADGMEVVDAVIAEGIKPIVFTSDCRDDTRDLIWSRKVVDYVLKEGGYNIDYLVYLFHRLEANRNVKIVLVDDSQLYREQISGTLRTQNFTVLPCASAKDALTTLEAHPDVRLVLTDYTMEGMDGFELVKEIRKKYKKEQLAVIGMSYRGDNRLSARFLKCGADDFLDKSFTTEQLYCRINQNVETLDMIHNLKEASVRDYLTGLHNRRYFYDYGEKLIQGVYRRGGAAMVAMVDIDHFKKVNDAYGHATGDAVIRFVANQLIRRFRKSDIVARFGGEEFCILAVDVDPGETFRILDQIRQQIAEYPICIDRQEIEVTVSIGLDTSTDRSLQALVDCADDCLYRAKNGGRNQVMKADSEANPMTNMR